MDGEAIYEDMVMDADISKPASTAERTDEYVYMRSSRNPEKPITSSMSVENGWPRWVTVALGVLCVVLTLLTICLCVKYTTERDQLKMERDQLKTERDQLKMERDPLKTERDQLQSRWSNVTRERDQLLSSNSNLTRERDQLQAVIDLTKNSDLKVSCPSGWNFNFYQCYLIATDSKPWSEARKVCQEMGADLVTIETEDEQVYINGLGKLGWIGLQRSGMSWMWVNGRPLSRPMFWGPGQPNTDTENCALSAPNMEKPTSNWHDYPCNKYFPSICEKLAN